MARKRYNQEDILRFLREIDVPIISKIHPVTMSEVRHNTQKERRIIDALEPVMNQHRLVIDKKVIHTDYDSCQHLPPE